MKKIITSIVVSAVLTLAITGCGTTSEKTVGSAAETQKTELRGVWVDKSDIYKGKEWLITALDKLEKAKFNAVFIPVFYKGYVSYPDSAIFPQDPKVVSIDKNLIPWMINEVHKHNMKAVAWPEYGFYEYYAADPKTDKSKGVILDKNPELADFDYDGKDYLENKFGRFYLLDPGNPKAQDVMTNLYLEMVTKYKFDEIDLDRIRYADEKFSFSPYSQKAFKDATGYELTKKNIFENSDMKPKQAYYKWRIDNLNKYIADLTQKLKVARPDLTVCAYVWTIDEINPKGQDWPLWLNSGYLDYAIPGMYDTLIEQHVGEDVKFVPVAKFAVGVTAEDPKKPASPRELEGLKKDIQDTRKFNTAGYVLWYLGPAMKPVDATNPDLTIIDYVGTLNK